MSKHDTESFFFDPMDIMKRNMRKCHASKMNRSKMIALQNSGTKDFKSDDLQDDNSYGQIKLSMSKDKTRRQSQTHHHIRFSVGDRSGKKVITEDKTRNDSIWNDVTQPINHSGSNHENSILPKFVTNPIESNDKKKQNRNVYDLFDRSVSHVKLGTDGKSRSVTRKKLKIFSMGNGGTFKAGSSSEELKRNRT